MPDACPAGGRRRATADRLAVARRVLVIGVACLSVLVASAAPARADGSTNTLRQKAAAIAARISNDDAALNSLGTQYLQARAELARSSAAARSTRGRVAQIKKAVTVDRASARAAATAAYVDSGAAVLGFYFGSAPSTFSFGEVYLGYVEGRIGAAVAKLRTNEAELKTALAAESAEADKAAGALSRATSTRTVVLATLASEQRLYGSIQGQIANLVAEQLAAARAAAARKAAAAAAATASSPATVAGPPSATTPLGPAPTGTLSRDFAAIRNCESGGNYQDDTGNGYYGAYQFSLSTWEGLGGTGLPSAAPPAAQDSAAYTLYRRDGWASWPACAAITGL